MKVYEIKADLDSFRFLEADRDFDGDELNGHAISGWEPKKAKWIDEHLPIGDFANIGGLGIAINKKTKEKMLKLGINMQCLPLDTGKSYEAINILNVIDAIDYENSITRKFSSGKIMMFTKYSFKKSLLENVFLFKIPELPKRRLFATDKFKIFVENNNLLGLKFIEVWDSEKERH